MRLLDCCRNAVLRIGCVCVQTGPAVADSDRVVRPVVTGIGSPSAMAFLTAHDFLLIEKNTGGDN